jgi:hypothetical protein
MIQHIAACRTAREKVAVGMADSHVALEHAVKFLEPMDVLVLAREEDGGDGRRDAERCRAGA